MPEISCMRGGWWCHLAKFTKSQHLQGGLTPVTLLSGHDRCAGLGFQGAAPALQPCPRPASVTWVMVGLRRTTSNQGFLLQLLQCKKYF